MKESKLEEEKCDYEISLYLQKKEQEEENKKK